MEGGGTLIHKASYVAVEWEQETVKGNVSWGPVASYLPAYMRTLCLCYSLRGQENDTGKHRVKAARSCFPIVRSQPISLGVGKSRNSTSTQGPVVVRDSHYPSPCQAPHIATSTGIYVDV